MKFSAANSGAFAFLIAGPLLPVIGFLLSAPPEMVFYFGVMSFLMLVFGLIWLLAERFKPPANSPPAVKPFRFTIRDLLCLTTILFGLAMFLVSAFRCEAAERASRPGPVPAGVFRQFVWELECGLVCMTVGGLVWVRGVVDGGRKEAPV